MPTFTNSSVDADEEHEAHHGLAHATRSIHDPSEIYAELGSVTSGLASLEQVLRQLGEFHDDPTSKHTWMTGDPRTGRGRRIRSLGNYIEPPRSFTRSPALWIAPMRSSGRSRAVLIAGITDSPLLTSFA
jgi:hypothetical protein